MFNHNQHPRTKRHLCRMKSRAEESKVRTKIPTIGRFNDWLGVRITTAVGTMGCAYLFALLAFVSLPEAVKGGTATFISWIAQTFLQLVLLSIIMVGQRVESKASDTRAEDTYKDAEAILHEAMEIQRHLAEQDAILQGLIDELKTKEPRV